MPQIFQLDPDGREQAAGSIMNHTTTHLYAMSVDNPELIIDLGGHGIPDAPEYQQTEAAPVQNMVHENGRNVLEDEYVSDDFVRSNSVTFSLPKRLYATADFIRAAQARGERFVYFIAPGDDCPDVCDRWSKYFGDNARMGVPIHTNGLVGFDPAAEGGGGMTRTVRVRSSGDLRMYHAVRYASPTVEDLAPLYTVLVGSRDECDAATGFCPWLVSYLGGGAGDEAAPFLQGTQNKFGDLDAITTTGIPAGSVVTSLARFGGRLYIGYASAFKDTSTAGGLAVSVGGGPISVVSDVTTDGIHALVVAGNRLHAFGEGGDWFYTDDGEAWVTATSFTSDDLFAAAYNPRQKRVYVVGADGAAYSIRPNGAASAIAGLSSVTDDLRSVAVLGDDHIAVGDDSGVYRETFGEVAGKAWTSRTFGADPIDAIVGDRRSTRVLVAVGDEIWERSINLKQSWAQIATAPAAITAGSSGYEEYQRGLDYVAFVTEDGEVIEIEQCVPCSLS